MGLTLQWGENVSGIYNLRIVRHDYWHNSLKKFRDDLCLVSIFFFKYYKAPLFRDFHTIWNFLNKIPTVMQQIDIYKVWFNFFRSITLKSSNWRFLFKYLHANRYFDLKHQMHQTWNCFKIFFNGPKLGTFESIKVKKRNRLEKNANHNWNSRKRFKYFIIFFNFGGRFSCKFKI
jgi:hypothetical protein